MQEGGLHTKGRPNSDYLQELLKLPGGGFQKFWRSTRHLFSPEQQEIRRKQINENLNHKISNLSPEHQTLAQLAAQSYAKPNERKKQVQDYHYIPEESSDLHSLHRNNDLNTNVLSFRGTSSIKDLIPDYFIAKGNEQRSKRHKNANELFKHLKEKYPNTTWKTTGHSLGGSQAMYVAQKNNIHSFAFNPGYVAYSNDQIDTDYPNHHVFVIKGDPISNSILEKNLANVNVLEPKQPGNMLEAHRLGNFIQE